MNAAENSEIEGDVIPSEAEDGARESLREERLVMVRRANEEMLFNDSHWKCIDDLGGEVDGFFGDGSRKLDMGPSKQLLVHWINFPGVLDQPSVLVRELDVLT